MSENIIVSVDPGREKCGVAVVEKNAGVLFKAVIDTSFLKETTEHLVREYNARGIILGDRTFSGSAKEMFAGVKLNDIDVPVILIDEHQSSEEARLRYWRENPPKGFWRLLPVTMQTPPVPVDDYVAVILAERHFKGQD
jgi:RNase H-fold protein (predicted Holliday junction resolvase)